VSITKYLSILRNIQRFIPSQFWRLGITRCGYSVSEEDLAESHVEKVEGKKGQKR
jgi:hypothetical protein